MSLTNVDQGGDPFNGKCNQLKASLESIAPKVVAAASGSIGLLDESLKVFCPGDCSTCPVDLARNGVKVTLDRAGSTILAITDWCESMAFQLSPKV